MAILVIGARICKAGSITRDKGESHGAKGEETIFSLVSLNQLIKYQQKGKKEKNVQL